MCCSFCFFFFKQKTAYELRISDWSSDVCSSDLAVAACLRSLHTRSRGGDIALIAIKDGKRHRKAGDQSAVAGFAQLAHANTDGRIEPAFPAGLAQLGIGNDPFRFGKAYLARRHCIDGAWRGQPVAAGALCGRTTHPHEPSKRTPETG